MHVYTLGHLAEHTFVSAVKSSGCRVKVFKGRHLFDQKIGCGNYCAFSCRIYKKQTLRVYVKIKQ